MYMFCLTVCTYICTYVSCIASSYYFDKPNLFLSLECLLLVRQDLTEGQVRQAHVHFIADNIDTCLEISTYTFEYALFELYILQALS